MRAGRTFPPALSRATARALVAAAAVLLAARPVSADHGYWPAAGVNAATVAGHATRTAAKSDAAYWGTDCATYGAGDGGLELLDVYGGILDRDYGIVVVLAAIQGTPVAGPTGITFFLGARDGEFVWADTDGNGAFGNALEADIQTVIACAHAAQAATDTQDGEAAVAGPGPIATLVLALAIAVAVLLALRLRGPRQG